ncbi:MAG: hypothetical protein OEW93_04995 [Candidatus Bathyarchaeota archaeon]|nr:hypothetical protein [Candidatus Bathyarchaeota archaeon]
MSESVCAACGRVLSQEEIRINERRFVSGARGRRYLCLRCRQREYNQYVDSIKKLIEKK